MGEQIFRKKSLDALSAPEELNDYLHVTQPAIWAVLVAVILVVAGLFVWAGFTSVASKVNGTAEVTDGVVTVTINDSNFSGRLETGMILTIGDVSVPLTSVGVNSYGQQVAGAEADIPNGSYSCYVTYRVTRILEFLFN